MARGARVDIINVRRADCDSPLDSCRCLSIESVLLQLGIDYRPVFSSLLDSNRQGMRQLAVDRCSTQKTSSSDLLVWLLRVHFKQQLAQVN